MYLFLNTIIILLLIVLTYQDFTRLSVNWFLLFFLILCQSGLTYLTVGKEDMLFYVGINTMLLIFQFLLLTIYFSIRSHRLTNIVNKFIGIGDIIFFIFLGLTFSPFNFMLFFITSLVLTLIVYAIFVRGKKEQYKIPLLGSMAVFYIVSLIIEQVSRFDRFDDTFMVYLFLE